MDALVTPSRTVAIGDETFALDGSFGTLRAVQEAFKKDLYQLRAEVIEFRSDQVAQLIAIGSGQPKEVNGIGQLLLDTMDVGEGSFGSEYITLKIELMAWLNVAMSKKADREKKRAEMQTLLDSRKAKSVSPGTTTSNLPSESSDGSPASSGAATSGN